MAGVEVDNLSFSYTRRGQNLENVSMVVPKGTIYGLLGPSGCCKTTLLRCIVGRLKARSGTVRIFGHKPGTAECGIPGPNIGYMPQDLSLISQFTVRETLEYYAGFAQTRDSTGAYSRGQAKEKQLNERIKFLLELLDIKDHEHRFTDQLSGGQKRRVSLAVAMINDPPLLILDEPTVGVDPIVRDAIWSYLLEQSQNGLTIIVTTHYIEEAASAHNVGFMRQGRILAEGNPTALMAQYHASTLENLFLMLSKYDDKTRTHESGNLQAVSVYEDGEEEGSEDRSSSPYTGPSRKADQVTLTTYQRNIAETGFSVGNGLLSNGSLKALNGIASTAPPSIPPPDYTSSTTGQTLDMEANNNSASYSANGVPPNGNCCHSTVTKESHAYTDTHSGQLIQKTKMEIITTNALSASTTSKLDTISRSKAHSRTYSTHAQSDRVNTFQKVGVLCRKHRLRLFRRVPELVITMLLPALEVALFCLCMGRDPTAIQMAVCNQERPPFMSMVFLKSIDPDFIQLKYYNTPEEAIDSVKNADTYSAIVLARNFTSSMHSFAAKVYPDKIGLGTSVGDSATTLAKMFQSRMTMPGTTTAAFPLTSLDPTEALLETPNTDGSSLPTSTPTPTSSTTTTIGPVSAIPIDLIDPNNPNPAAEKDDSIIKIYYDGSNALHVNIIRRELFSAVFRFVDYLGKLVGATGIANQLPIKFEKPIYGNEKTDMIEFVGPGLMVFIVFFATMSITSMAFLSERREGTLERSLIVGMTPTEFIISQIINITFLLIVQITLTVVMGFWIFSFPMKGSYLLAVTMMFCQGLCGMTYGLMLSAICTNEMTALMLGAGSQLMFCFITGIFWPVDTMIPLLRYFSYMMPQTLPMESFRHILIRGFDLSRPAVFNGYIISVGWVVFFLMLAIAIFRFR